MGRVLLISILVLLGAASVKAETSYSDVAVIINTNSAASQSIGQYFRVARNIPLTNVIYIQTDTTEEIDSTMFNLLRSQVEDQLILNGIRDSINYLVTTKGVPLKVNRGSTYSQSSPSSSVESELMLILGVNAVSIGGAGPQMSPYFYQNAHFSRAAYGIYLVTRLDGYNVADVLNLIDRSGPDTPVSPQATFLFDQDPAWSSPLNTYMARAKTTLENRGMIVSLDATTTYQTNHQNLIGYMSWGSNDHYQYMYTQNAIPHNTYARGAIAETYVSTSGRSFINPPNYGQSLVADLIGEGISGVKGYVYEHVEWELKEYFPDAPRDSFISDMHILSGDSDQNNILMVCVRRDLIQKLHRSLARLRLGLDIVDVDHFSVDNALRFNFPAMSNKFIALVGLKNGRIDASLIRYNDLESYTYSLYASQEEAVDFIGELSKETKGLSAISLFGTHLNTEILEQTRSASLVPIEALNPLRSVPLANSARASLDSEFAAYRYCAAVGAALRRD